MRVVACAWLVLFAVLVIWLVWIWSRNEVRASITWSREDQPEHEEEGEGMDISIHVGHSRMAHFKAEADDGSVVPPAGPVTWSCDDPSKIELDPTPAGDVCTVKGLAITTSPVLIHATDGLTVATSVPIDVIPEPETHAEITFDDEV